PRGVERDRARRSDRALPLRDVGLYGRRQGDAYQALMAIDTGAVDRALGAIGTTFRLTRLYPPSHPAVLEAMRHITASLPALAGLGSVEWKIGATGLHWHGQHSLPPSETVAPSRSSNVFRPNVLPADVEARRAVTALLAAAEPVEQRASIEQLRQLTPDVIALRDIGAVAEVVAGLDRSLGKIQ